MYYFTLIQNNLTLSGCAISWKPALLSTIVLSTTEVEYMAATKAMNLRFMQDVIIVYCDSQSAIHLTKNQMYHERIKYM